MGKDHTDIIKGEAVLGIELGSTRIKAVLIDREHRVLASGSFAWENRLENGIWTYSLDEVWRGVQNCYADLKENVRKSYGVKLQKLAAMGISAMMHGYLVFDEESKLLSPFRTWRNINANRAAAILSEELAYNIPDRWSVAHLYQSILDKEEHVGRIRFMTTLAGYVHWKLSKEKVLGVGDASGMFPIDTKKGNYHRGMLDRFSKMIEDRGYPWKPEEILPRVLLAGEDAGRLSPEGARLIDPSGDLEAGILLCPPEGDAGTGMVATDSVAVRTGNISAGTSIFAMLVLEKELSKPYREVDMVTTPDGHAVAMVHANNCTSDINAWVGIFEEFLRAYGVEAEKNKLFSSLFLQAEKGDKDCGGLLSYGYLSGESITKIDEGRPLFVRKPDARFTLANFMRSHLYSALGALRIGMDILIENEGIEIDKIYGHGGLFKTPDIGQRIMAAGLNLPVSLMETAGEGGPWGIAVLAAYMVYREQGEGLPEYLNEKVFYQNEELCVQPDPDEAEGFNEFMKSYIAGLAIEKKAVEVF
ncbi:MAG: FGGY-family carbohydrate kinase [Johnsonella sp.]|nr:FGGY-family carbohydrate kinase [Johnsonella sp.]